MFNPAKTHRRGSLMIILSSITLGLWVVSLYFLIAKKTKADMKERAQQARRDAIKRRVGE